MATMTFGVALFGTGRIGNMHLKDILDHPRLSLLWLVEADVERANSVAARLRLRDVNICDVTEAAKVYEDPMVDCVLVCTPSISHQAIVEASLQAGKAVFCEKPLAFTTGGITQCYQTAKQHGKPLFCAFNRRFDPQIRELYTRIRRGELGKLRMLKTTSRDPLSVVDLAYIRQSGGVFTDSAIHDIDLLSWLVGESPCKVYATGYATDPAFAECDDVDTCSITLNFPGGAIGNIEVSRSAPIGYDQRTEVFGTKGMIISGNQSGMVVVQQSQDGISLPPIKDSPTDRYRDSYRLELDHFIEVLEGKVNMEVTEESTTYVNKVADACKVSMHSGAAVALHDLVKGPA